MKCSRIDLAITPKDKIASWYFFCFLKENYESSSLFYNLPNYCSTLLGLINFSTWDGFGILLGLQG